MMRTSKRIVAFFCFLGVVPAVLSAPLEPVVKVFRQPDGFEFRGRMLGDEFVVFYETVDGFTISKNDAGWWCYAEVGSDGRLEASALRVGGVEPGAAGLQRHMRHAPEIMAEIRERRTLHYDALRQMRPFRHLSPQQKRPLTYGVSAIDNHRLAVLLVEFPDLPATYQPEDFQQLLFSENFTYVSPEPDEPAYGSLRDYYRTMSNGILDVTGQVFEWVTADFNRDYYDKNGNISFEAVAKSGVNLDEFDGYAVVYAGTVASASSNLWPQALIAGGTPHYLMSERWLPKYKFAPIGVHCHEFGHLLGLPDLYDIDFSSSGVGNWCTMGTGNFGAGHHERPFHYSAWSKLKLGWITPMVLYNGNHTGVMLRPVETKREVYKVVSFASYFLLANRSKCDYDFYLPGEGLLIWHIDDRFGSQSADDHRLVDLEEADGQESAGDSGDLFPGKTQNTAFGASTTPSSKDYNGQSYFDISNIALIGENIFFDIMIDLGAGAGITLNNSGNFPNIFTALESAVPGDSVFVPRGTYFENNLQLGNGVTLRGQGAGSTIIDGQGRRLFEIRNIASGEISHLTLMNGATAVVVLDANIEFKYNLVSNMTVNGILCFRTQAMIQNNTVINIAAAGLSCLAGASPIVKNNIFSYNGAGIAKLPEAMPELSYNDVWNNGINYQNLMPGAADISADPLFANPFFGDYRLLPDSPCINAGDPDQAFNDSDSTRNDIGAIPFDFSSSFVENGLRLNAGGEEYLAADSMLWLQDQPFIEGVWGFIGGTAEKTTDPITHTDNDSLYQTVRKGIAAYYFDIPNGRYLVRLHFVEIEFLSPGERIFDVMIEGGVFLVAFDIFSQVGHDFALEKQLQVLVDDGRLQIDFIPHAGEPIVAAVEVLPVSPPFIDIAEFAKVADPGFGLSVAMGDYDGNGAVDIFIANAFKTNTLFQNNGFGTFINQTRPAGMGLPDGGEAAAWGDFNNDNLLDLYVVRKEMPNLLYKNLGGGTFQEVAVAAGVTADGSGKTAAWADYDNDGYLDLYVATTGGDLLYRNNSDETFTDVTMIADLQRTVVSNDALWGDFDNDGHIDLLVCRLDNTFASQNFLYYNNGDGTFTGFPLGKNGLGATAGDFDNDGDLDIFMISVLNPFGQGEHLLFRNDGEQAFANIAAQAGLSSSVIGVSASWGDFDNDGYLDLFVLKNASNDQFFQNNRDGTFSNISDSVGIAAESGVKAMAFGDIDYDGDLDIYLSKEGKANSLYQNQHKKNNWLTIKTRGRDSNRAGIGARIRLVTGMLVQHREVEGGSGFRAQNSLQLEFGVGESQIIDTLQIFWPSGKIDIYTEFSKINRVFEAIESPSTGIDGLTFVAYPEENQTILKWSMANDFDLSSFQIERRKAGTGSYRILDTISENGAGLPGQTYTWKDTELALGRYFYRLKIIDRNGKISIAEPIEITIAPPHQFRLNQNFPNPVRFDQMSGAATTFRYALPKQSVVILRIYNVLGQEVFATETMPKEAGFHALEWDGRDKLGRPVSQGVYFYLLQANESVLAKKMAIIRARN